MPICIYPSDCTDFSTNGLSVLTPISCTVTQEEGGMFELEVTQPIDSTNRWAQLTNGAIIKAPVPVRESPLMAVEDPDSPSAPGSPAQVTRNLWEVTWPTVAGMRSRPTYTSPSYGVLKKGDRAIEIRNQYNAGEDITWYLCITQRGGVKCWLNGRKLTKVGTVSQTVNGIQATGGGVTPQRTREQLFRIYKVERDSKEQTVTASAMHIFYDLRANIVGEAYDMQKKRPANVVLQELWDKLVNKESGFTLYIDGSLTKRVQGNYGWKNIIECLMDPDEGILAQAGARLVRDNYDIYVIPDGAHDTQVTIRRGKNLKGVTVTEDASGIVTRIIPCGKNKKGKDLLLDSDPIWIDSPHINDYPIPYIQKIDYDVKISGKEEGGSDDSATDIDNETVFADATAARAKLRQLAQADFEENGVDLPSYGMEVDFVLLENSPDSGEGYADLQSVFLGDTVSVIDSLVHVSAKLRVTSYEWDALTLQYSKVNLGDVESVDQTVYSYNLPSGGISGSKIATGSMSGDVLRDLTVQYAKFDQATIEQLIAESLTAVEANIENLIAGHITADSITAGLIEAVTGIIQNLKAGSIDADELTARFAEFATVVAGTATFDRETVQHLVAEAMHLSFGEADSVFIQNLMVTYAQFAAATIGDLVVKASDGKYYHLDVNPTDGTVTATPADVTEGDITSGHTTTGETIIDTNILAENLSTANLFATYALINQIDAARIDVDQLFAREAFLDLLWTSQIHGDESIEFWAHNSVNKVVTEYCISDSPSMVTNEEGWSEEYPKEVLSNQYIWRRLKAYKGSGQYEITSLECITLQQGAVGPQGVGIESVEEFYGLSASSAAQPSEWTSEPKPPTPELRYLWNKETIHYTDKSSQEGKPHIIGVFGEDGKIGRGIEEIINYYLASSESSGVTRATEGWTTTMQATSDEKRYLWNYEETVWSDGSEHTYTNPIIIGTQGVKGDPGPQGNAGEQGIEGPPGPEGKSSYFHIKYSAKENPTSSADMTEEASTYIGTYVDFTEADSNDPFKYKWQRLEGAQGKDGKQGIPGDNGVDGKTSYLHIKYSNDGKTFTANEGEDPGDWIGQYVDFTLEDSTNFGDYKWSKIKGEQGQPGLQGLQGEKGEDGIDGSPGKDGSDGSSINLLLGTKDFSGSWTNRGSYSEGESVGDFTMLTKTAAWSGVNQTVSVEPGDYTFSCWVKTGASALVVYYTPNANSAETPKLSTWVNNITITPNTWTHIVGHTTAKEAATLNPRVEIKSATDVSLYGYKLEAGNVANPVWTPNPADLATYFHIKYSAKENPTTAADMTETPDVYIGTYVDNVKEDSTDPKKYQWYRFQGLQGEKGEQGIPGVGQDGKTYYLHIKYSNDGGKSFTGNSGEDSGAYIGVCTDTTEADPTDVSKYKWSKIKGENGAKGDKGEDGSQGINLLRRTAEYAYSAKGASVTLTQDGDFTVANLPMVASGGNEWGNNIVSLNIPFSNVRNQTATLSLDIKCDDVSKYTSGTNGLYFAAQLYYEGSGRQFTQNINPFKTITLSADWTRVRQVIDCHDAKFTRESSNTSYNIGDDTLININVYNRSTTTGLHIRKLKLELGDVSNPVWTPNPSDVSYTPVPQYYLSTSPTTQTGGSWSETQPTWKANTYIWERLRCVWSDGRADTFTTPQRALALEQALKAAQDAKDVADAAQLSAANAVDGLNNLNGEMGDLHDHLRSLDTRMTLVGNSDDADEAPSTLRPAGLYVGLDGWPVQAYIDATGWFRVWANGRSVTAMGPNEIDLGDLVFYNNGQDVSVMKKG